ncbi:MAG: hypothetical protein K2Y14_03970 [Burkholderiales bacterium]|nr:hypothetical protein [Burkholderiales bacterium]
MAIIHKQNWNSRYCDVIYTKGGKMKKKFKFIPRSTTQKVLKTTMMSFEEIVTLRIAEDEEIAKIITRT